jgi:methyl-accepting chemotaxis protein
MLATKGLGVRKKISLKAVLSLMVLCSLVLVGGIITGIATYNLRKGMEEEVLQGVKAACQTYAMVLKYTAEDESTAAGLEFDMNKKTGYDYTYFVGDTRKRSSISGAIGTKAGAAVIDAVIDHGQSYLAKDVVINGEKYYVAYEPLTEDGSSNVYGMAFVGLKKSAVSDYIAKRSGIVSSLAVFFVAILTVMTVLYVLQIVKALEENVKAVRKMATGSLDVTLSDKVRNRNDELGEMSRALTETADKIRSVIGNARTSSSDVDRSAEYLYNSVKTIAETSDNVAVAVNQVTDGAYNQAESLQDAVKSVSNINEAIQLIMTNTDEMHDIADLMQTNSKASQERLSDLRTSTGKSISAINGIVELIGNTNSAVTTISEAVAIIDSIAEETNLLSLNASIESARAGEAGRGFAVVADQIRQLADQSADAAKNIQEAMQGLSADSNKTMEEAAIVQDAMNVQKETIHQTIEQVAALISDIDRSVALTKEIVKNVRITEEARNEISETISGLSAIAEENAASSEETKASMQELTDTMEALSQKANNLNDVAKGLEAEMAFFQ